jgi:hypothetical protein
MLDFYSLIVDNFMKDEATLQTAFSHWLSSPTGENFLQRFGSCCFELKISKTNSIPFSKFAPHQIRALDLAQNKSLYFKIPDVSLSPSPFDCFCLHGASSFAVVMFECDKRGQKDFYIIDIEQMKSEMKFNKSLKLERMPAIGRHCCLA